MSNKRNKRYYFQFSESEEELRQYFLEKRKDFKSDSATIKYLIQIKSLQELIEIQSPKQETEQNFTNEEAEYWKEKYVKLKHQICNELVSQDNSWVDIQYAKELRSELLEEE